MQLLKPFKPFTKENILRLSVLLALQLFTIGSIVYFTVAFIQGTATVTQMLMALATIAFLLIPDLAQWICKFRIPTLVYIFVLFYAFCPMLGHTYGLYYYVWWWDKALHVAGGVVFALFGAYLPKVFLKTDKCSVWLCVISGFMFSLGIAVLWEVFEFTLDSLCNTDMQKDRIITEIHSYLLNDQLVGATSGEKIDITQVVGTVIQLPNGQMITIKGYLDVGRLDTMYDMIVEAVGALVFSVAYVIDKGRYTALHYLPETSGKTAPPVENEPAVQEEAAVSQTQETKEE